ncbi:response regulator [uncultured Phenylobacterium sp.]|uniref:response regulator n=1 Tax=uncultured Phenylobacterium sp. TaxID=349273 RepID=UPI0025D7FB3A|nr:response regulator [uncultured Phenylobacterium sp.]
MSTRPSPLTGLRILVVDDEPLVALMIEDLLADLGCEVVGPVASVADALPLAQIAGLSGALLDVNLGDEVVYPVAEVLQRAGIPFAFVTGYAGLGVAPEFAGAPVLRKPLDIYRFEEQVVAALLGTHSPGSVSLIEPPALS